MLPRKPLVSSVLVLLVVATGCNRATTSTSPSSTTPTTAAAKLSIDRSSYGFPNTLVGDVSQSPTLQVSASGGGSLTVASVTSSNPAEFQLVNDASCVGLTLTASASSMCQIAVKFKPSVARSEERRV